MISAITETVDWPADETTPASLTISETNPFITIDGQLDSAIDEDWIALDLSAELDYRFIITSSFIPLVEIYRLVNVADEAGPTIIPILVAQNIDLVDGFVASVWESGTYYLEVESPDTISFGAYQIIGEVFPPVSASAMAQQLTTDYWVAYKEEAGPRPFAVGADGQITFDAGAFTGQTHDLVVDALNAWGALIGIQFVETPGNAEVVFQAGTADDVVVTLANGEITAATVTVDSLNLLGGADATYQTFLHLVGHVLGLGHPGNYEHDGTADFLRDAAFSNDSLQMSVMSAFSSYENPAAHADYAYAQTPMVADVAALDSLYGLSGNINSGDTLYGYNSGDTATDPMTWEPEMAYAITIVDSGGVDTLDFSGNPQPAFISMQPGGFSDLGYGWGNLGIAEGTIIENLLGSAYDDFVVGNDAANNINVSLGHDMVNALGGDDFVIGWYGLDELLGGDGNDLLLGGGLDDRLWGQNDDDRLYGQQGNDMLSGGNGADFLKGNDGDDILRGDRGNDLLFGGEGNDTLHGGRGVDKLWGGGGADEFAFIRGYHREVIKDFQDDVDTINLTDLGFASIADAMALATQEGTAVRFDFSGVAGASAADVLWVMNTTLVEVQDDIIV